jgi:hypothetical protein
MPATLAFVYRPNLGSCLFSRPPATPGSYRVAGKAQPSCGRLSTSLWPRLCLQLIPKSLHYCFGMTPDFGGKPWGLVHHVCLRSAAERIRPKDIFFYCEYEPTGPWWELTRPMVTLKKIRAPREIFGNPLIHPAHRTDLIRLEKLFSEGGVYLDADVFVHRSFDELLKHATVLGEQRVGEEITGLCNAVIVAEKGAPFLARWISEFRSFRSKGHDAFWDEHAVKVPHKLSKEFPCEVTTLPYKSFFWPTFIEGDLARIFGSPDPLDLSDAYATHLWESPAWERYLQYLTPGRVRKVDSNFHRWARPLVEALPDDYGAPGKLRLMTHGVVRLKRQFLSAVLRHRGRPGGGISS